MRTTRSAACMGSTLNTCAIDAADQCVRVIRSNRPARLSRDPAARCSADDPVATMWTAVFLRRKRSQMPFRRAAQSGTGEQLDAAGSGLGQALGQQIPALEVALAEALARHTRIIIRLWPNIKSRAPSCDLERPRDGRIALPLHRLLGVRREHEIRVLRAR